MREGPIVRKTVAFSITVIKFCEALQEAKKFIISNQLLKAGTSIGANVFEAQFSESRIDFIHKMKVALKEANETFYWLHLCEKSGSTQTPEEMMKEIHEIMLLLSKIISTSKKNLH